MQTSHDLSFRRGVETNPIADAPGERLSAGARAGVPRGPGPRTRFASGGVTGEPGGAEELRFFVPDYPAPLFEGTERHDDATELASLLGMSSRLGGHR